MKKNNYRLLAGIFFLFLTFSANIRSQSNIVITEVLYDSPLPEYKGASGAHNGEFVELYNPTANKIDISGWRLWTRAEIAYYAFPSGTSIASGAFLIVAYRNANTPGFQLKDLYPQAIAEGNNRIIYQNSLFFSNGQNHVRLINKKQEIDRVSYTGVYKDYWWDNAAWNLAATNRLNVLAPQNSLSLQRVLIPDSGTYESAGYFTVAPCTPFSFSQGSKELSLVKNPLDKEAFDRYSNSVDVGSITGQSSVSPSGAATYRISIDMPAGINGCQPAVSLVYNSQGGNGVAGWGFSVAGLSAITRVPQTIYSDGSASGIKNNANDKYALDGNRLVSINGLYGADKTEYRTETETFNKIISFGSYGNNGPERFEATDKNGTIYKYGSAGGKFLYSKSGKTSVQYWSLDNVTNPDSTGISYEYENTGNFLYIKKISYGDNSIVFTYKIRSDSMSCYFDGQQTTINRILDKIEVKNGSQLYRKYELSYSQDAFSRLAKITESNGAGKSFNPTVFDWGSYPSKTNIDVKNVTVTASSLEPDFSKQYYSSVDLNGDGLADIISYFPYKVTIGNSSNYTEYYYTGIQMYIAKKDGDNVKFEAGISGTITASVDMDLIKTKYGGFLTGDIYGRGIQNAILPVYNKVGSNSQVGFLIFQNSSTYSIIAQNLVSSSELPEISVGDVDNDGKCELLYIEKGKTGGAYMLNIGGYGKIGFDGTNPYTRIPLSITSNPGRMLIADFNGDGMNDLMVVTKEGYHIYWNQGGALSNLFSASNKTVGTLFNSDYSEVQIGDFNGDGLPDLILNEKNNSKWHLAINQGNGFFATKALPQITAEEEGFTCLNDDQDRCFVTDFDGDGKSDIILSDSKYKLDKTLVVFNNGGDFVKNGHTVNWYRSTGNDLELVKSTTYDNQNAKIQYYAFGDFKGTGSVQMMFYGYDCYNGYDLDQKWRLYDNAGLTAESGKIKGVTDGMNNRTQFTYKPLTDQSIYTSNVASTYPVVPLTGPLYAVDKMTQTNGVVAGNAVNQFTYKNGRIHLQGKGFLGFEQIKMTNSLSNSTQIQDFGKIDTTYFYPVSTKTTVLVGADTISTSFSANKAVALGGKRVFSYTDSIAGYDYLNDVRSLHTFIYDANEGNVIEETTVAGVVSGANGEVVSNTKYQYGAFGGNGYKNKLTEKTTTAKYLKNSSSLEYESPFTQTQQYRYDGKGRLTAEIANAGTPDSVTTDYLNFNKLSLPETVKASAKDKDSGKTTSMTGTMKYDDCGRVLEKTNSLGETQKYAYNSLGWITSQTDHLNNTTGYDYDSWGKQWGTSYPTGSANTVETGWVRSVGGFIPQGALYYTYSESPDNNDTPCIYTYYDSKGRELRTVTNDAFGKKIVTDTYYDEKGQVSRASQPYFEGSTPEYTTYGYDGYGRKIEEKTKNSIVTETKYDKRTVTTTYPDETTSKQTVNAAGNIISAEDAMGNATTYAYHSSGQPREIIAVGSSFQMEYDDCGRQIRLIDPNAGATDYRYDAFGNVVWQKDAKGNETSTAYDALGRVTESKTGTVTTAYKYNQYGVASISTADAYETFGYDRFGRVTTHEQAHSGTSYQTGYAYDTRNNVTQRTYPSGVTVNYSYRSGYLTNISDGNKQPIWKLDNTNALGQPLQYSWGNGIATNYTYDAFDMLASKATAGISEMNYLFDKNTGNLNYRREKHDNISQQEYFEYDNLSRLQGWKPAQNDDNLAYETVYSPNGNIDYKTGVGEYMYDEKKQPNAIKSIENLEGYAPSFLQSIRYNVFNRVESISEGADSLSFAYGVDQQRFKTFLYKNNILVKEKHFAENYEAEIAGGKKREIHYIAAPTGLVAVLIRSANADSLFYVCTDHLGSIIAIADATGKVLERRSFDAWGRERNPDNWDDYSVAIAGRLDRGYTGHEHLPQFGLINMNARLYDPVLGRFLSPDPFVQAPDFSQNFNRYSYCLNNPLIYTDPSGEFFWLIPVAAAIIGGYIGGGIQSGNWNPISSNYWNNGWQGVLKGFAAGALIGTALAVVIDAAPLIVGAAPGTTTPLYGMGVGLTQVVEGATQGVLTSATSAILTDAASGKWNNFSDDLLTADITGIITGALTPEMNKGMGAIFRKNSIKDFTMIEKIVNSGVQNVAKGIIKDEVKDVYKYGWSGFWNASIYNNGSNINSDMVTNLVSGVLNFTNYMDFTPATVKTYGQYPFSDSNRKYLQGLYPNIGKGLISTVWNSMTKIKVVNGRFEYAPDRSIFYFNSLIKSIPPLFVPKGF